MTDAYKIGVTVALTNLVSSELTKIMGGMKAAEGGASSLKLGLMAIGGAAVLGAVAGVGAALKAGYEEASKFQTEVNKFRMYGLGDKLNADAVSFAKNMKIAGVNMTDSLRYVNEAQGVFRESGRNGPEALEGAKIAAPILAKLDFINKSLYGEDKHGESLAMLRFIDMMGGNKSAGRFGQLADMGFKLKTTSGGQVDWEALRQFRSHAMSAGFNLSDQLFAELEPIIGELKGSTSGTALRTAYNRAHGIIKPPNQAVDMLVKMGAWDSSKFTRNKLGGIKNMNGDPLVDAELYDSNFIEWYRKHALPYYEKHGFSQNQRIRSNALAFGSTGGSMMSLVDRQGAVITASAEAFKKALGIEDAKRVADSNSAGKAVRLTQEWSDLMNNIGTLIMPAVNYGLRILTGILKDINGLLSHPETKLAPAGSLAMEGLLKPLISFLAPQTNAAKMQLRENIYGNITTPRQPAAPVANSNIAQPVVVKLEGDIRSIVRKVTVEQANGMSGPTRQMGAPDYFMSYRPN